MNVHKTDVIKRRGKRSTESFVPEKLHSSVLSACLSVKSPEGEAETIATIVSDLVDSWRNNRHAVTSHDLRRVAAQHLEHLHPEAAYLYQHHQLVL
jgi:hypothetical protein